MGLVTLNINKRKNNKFLSLEKSVESGTSESEPANHSPKGAAGAPVADIKVTGSSEYFFLSFFLGTRFVSGSLGVVELSEHESEKGEEATKQPDTRLNLFKAKDALSRVKTICNG